MDDAALDKLISEIQEFLRDSEQDDTVGEPAPVKATVHTATSGTRLTTRAMMRTARIARVMEMCAYSWAMCVLVALIGLLGFQRPLDGQATVQIFAVAAFGVFTTLTLLGSAQRLTTLLRIERNTREVLRLRRTQNTLLARLVDRNT